MFLRAGRLAAAVMFAALTACSSAPQKVPPEGEDGATPVHNATGDEPGGVKSGRACTSLGIARDGTTPDESIKRDSAAAEKDLARANELFVAGDYGAALAAYASAAKADPFQGLAYLGVAESHLFTDNDQTAMKESIARALALMPTNPRAHLRAGDLAAEAGEKPRAEAHFRCALELRPDYADAQKRLAKHLFAEQRFGEAEELIIKIDAGEDVETIVLAADIFEGEKKFLEAAEKVALAAEQVKTSAALWRRAAALYESAGNLVLAKKTRAAADKIDPPEKERALRPLPKARKR